MIVVIGSALCAVAFSLEFSPSESPASSVEYSSERELAGNAALVRLEEIRQKRDWPSLSVAVGYDGRLLWAGAVGFSDVSETKEATPDTRYRVGSVAKPMTATALAQQVGDGILAYRDSLHEYVPNVPKHWADISLLQLANHTAGIRHYRKGLPGLFETFSNRQYENVGDALMVFKEDPLEFEPGTRYRYSSYGYNLLSAAMEGAEGKEYLELMRDRIFHPADMRDTFPEHVAGRSEIANMATPYFLYKGLLMKTPAVNTSVKWAGGGFVSTPSDLVRFGLHLSNDHYIGEDARKFMWTIAQLNDGLESPGSYGLGFRKTMMKNIQSISHGGNSIGGTSYFAIYPNQKLIVAVASNVTDLSGEERIEDYLELALLFAKPNALTFR